MPILTPKSESVSPDGTADGWQPWPGFLRDTDPHGQTRIVVQVPTEHLAALHLDLIATLTPPLGLLYRQVVNRRDPKPQGSPPRDFVALELPADAVLTALRHAADLIYHDARCELWVRGRLGEQVVLDADGLIFCYPDDPVVEDVLRGAGLTDDLGQTITDRDYAKHWFHAENDAVEDALIRELRLAEVAHRKA